LADALGLAGDHRKRTVSEWLGRYGPVVAILLAYLLLRWLLFGGMGEHRLALLESPSGPSLSLLHAIQTAAAPFVELVYEPPVDVWFSAWRSLASLLAALLVAAAAYRSWAAIRTPVLFWLGWILLTLLPTANLLDQEAPFAERFVFLALVGVLGIVAAAASTAWDRPAARRLISIAGVLAAAGLAAISFHRGQYYQNDLSFHQQWVRTSPRSAQAQGSLGWVLLEQDRLDEAEFHLKQAILAKPAHAEAYNNLGNVQEKRGDLPGAVAYFQQAVRFDPNCYLAHCNLGNAFGRQGDLPRAAAHFQQALRVQPNHSEAHNGLGVVLARQGDLAGAARHFEHSLRANPNNAEAHNNLGNVLDSQGDLERAARHYREALRIAPHYATARASLQRVMRRLRGSDRPAGGPDERPVP
jgi:tetratricopeptide (TPR) repeat protein